MMDFLRIVGLVNKRGVTEIYPRFNVPKSKDLMIRGGDFYAIWDQEKGMWSTDEDDAIRLIDAELDAYVEKHKAELENGYRVMYMKYSETGSIDVWHKFCQRQGRDNYHMLDSKLTFLNTVTTREDYVSKRLSYPLEEGEPEAWNHLMSVLYSPEERRKIEWAIGSVVAGESIHLQKFVVIYGEQGSGKSTVLNIIKKLFKGYCETIDAKALGNSGDAFALEAFRSNPLVGIDHEGKLSRIDDNSRLNALVAHEEQVVNEKNTKRYKASFNTFMFIAANDPVKITNAKSGIMRRLIDVSPTGKKLPRKDYDKTFAQIDFELGKIASHCKKVFEEDPHFYDTYSPIAMMEETNDFFNFVSDSYYIFKKEDGVSEQAAWDMYKVYVDEAKVPYPLSRKDFRNELKNYFETYSGDQRVTLADGSRPRKYYSGFRSDKFEVNWEKQEEPPPTNWLIFDKTESLFDKEYADCPAQYSNEDGKPIKPWSKVETKLADLDTTKEHYVRVPVIQVVIDFDKKDENGNKSLEKNLEAASLWPKTYAELSKSGVGIHLHYIYNGDPNDLNRVFGDQIEIKVFTGKSSLRRRLTYCNDIPIAVISSGLPLREKKKMADEFTIKSEATLVNMLKKNLRKEYHKNTKPSVDYMYYLLEKAYEAGIHYDVEWMHSDIYSFAAASTNQSDECLAIVRKMKFQSKDVSEQKESEATLLTGYDVESCPNHFLVCYALDKEGATVVDMLDPKPDDIYSFIERKLVSFNGLSYDDNMLYSCMIGETPAEAFARSNRIIKNNDGKFREAKFTYIDLYQILPKKQSLKKWEIELGLPHKEFPIPWDQPIPDDRLQEWIEYCKNDVRATLSLLHSKEGKAALNAHKILVVLGNGKMSDTTNQLTAKIIFQGNREPQSQFNYRNMGEIKETDIFPYTKDDPYTRFSSMTATKDGLIGVPVFPGYIYSKFGFPEHNGAKSWYRDEDPKEGGYVYAEPGIHTNVALLDIASMHPSSIIAENLFGDIYTKRFKDIVDVRILIKHRDFDKARQVLDGALAGYLTDESAADELSSALKIAINAVYGQTSASFTNPFRDERNIDNIVAKRGALFMINLKHAVQERGFQVAHIKTDSIKIPNATPEIIKFVTDYGKMYGYTFEHEATYEKMCLVNDAVYIAKYASEESCMEQYGYLPTKQKPGKWTATGTQFQVPYVFKKLFSHEDLEFKDTCETKEVKNPASLYLDFNESLGDEHDYRFVGRVGLFCPVKAGAGGAELLRGAPDSEGQMKYGYASSSKGYRWMEADMVKNLKLEDGIDYSYYDTLVNKAADAISQYGDLEWFLS